MRKDVQQKMTAQELAKKYGITESELYVYACKYLDGFRESTPHERSLALDAINLQNLEQRLKKERNDHAEWPNDPADEEPDDYNLDFPLSDLNEADPPKDAAKNLGTESIGLDKMIERLESEKTELAQELSALRHEHLAVQRDAAAKQAELFAQVAQAKQNGDVKISVLQEEIAVQKQLASERLKEIEERNVGLEDRNVSLEQQLLKAQEKYNHQTEELMNLQHAIQELRDAANKKGTQQALELLDAQGQQEKLAKTIHEKELEIMEAKEKHQELLGKYNAALGRIGEMVGKVLKARERMKEISAEFDVYIDAEEEKPAAAVENADNVIKAANEPHAPDPVPPSPICPNPETVEILGNPVGETPTVPETVIKEQAKPTLWRRIASFF